MSDYVSRLDRLNGAIVKLRRMLNAGVRSEIFAAALELEYARGLAVAARIAAFPADPALPEDVAEECEDLLADAERALI